VGHLFSYSQGLQDHLHLLKNKGTRSKGGPEELARIESTSRA